ncbi:hypothetical protein V7139_32150, partial [Neobacillus drentensis]|uniref:hypothetical protein n=1 Tax=Neobacillus drentensis TaxID=220684 RepID=UPI0030036FC0
MDEEQDFIDKQLESIDLLLYKMRFYQDVYDKWVKINLGVNGMKLTDKERDNWDEYQKFLIDRGTKESITDAKELCDLISSERTAWEEIKRVEEENKRLTDQLQDALNTLKYIIDFPYLE